MPTDSEAVRHLALEGLLISQNFCCFNWAGRLSHGKSERYSNVSVFDGLCTSALFFHSSFTNIGISVETVNVSYPHYHNYKGHGNTLPSSFFLVTSFNFLSSSSNVTVQLKRTWIIELGAVQNSNYANLTHADTVLNFLLLHYSPFWK